MIRRGQACYNCNTTSIIHVNHHAHKFILNFLNILFTTIRKLNNSKSEAMKLLSPNMGRNVNQSVLDSLVRSSD